MSIKPPECWRLDPQARALRVETSIGHSILLPFEHLVVSAFDNGDDGETLKMEFSSHEILLRGVGLKRVEAALQRRELAEVSVLPLRFRESTPKGHPIIHEIQVTIPEEPTATAPAKGKTQ